MPTAAECEFTKMPLGSRVNGRLEAWQGDCAPFGGQSQIRITMDRHWNCRAAFVSGP